MERPAAHIMAVLMWFILPAALCADTTFTQADRLFSSSTPARVLESARLYARISDDHPESYEAAWKASRAFRQYCFEAPPDTPGNREDLYRTYGKLGMKYGARAMSIAPGRVEGNFWNACSMAWYAQGIGTMGSIREGLKEKVLACLERSYSIDRLYDSGGPIIALGRYWHVLPWPYADRKKSLAYLREYQRLFPRDPEGQVYLAELLVDLGKKPEARSLLEKAASSGDSHFSRRAASILTKW